MPAANITNEVSEETENAQEFNEFHKVESIEELLGQFAGIVSMCWEHPDKAGEFKSEHVAFHLDEALERLQDLVRTSVAEYIVNSAGEIASYLPIFGLPGDRAEIVEAPAEDSPNEEIEEKAASEE